MDKLKIKIITPVIDQSEFRPNRSIASRYGSKVINGSHYSTVNIQDVADEMGKILANYEQRQRELKTFEEYYNERCSNS